MASIDSVVTAIKAAIPTYTGFSSKNILFNTYVLEDNPSNVMEDSWGLIIGSGSRSAVSGVAINREVSTVRSIGVILCRAVYDLHGSGQEIDTQISNLLLDAKTIRDNFLSDVKFGVLKGGEEISYDGDSGVGFVNTEKERFIYTQLDFTFEIIEQIN